MTEDAERLAATAGALKITAEQLNERVKELTAQEVKRTATPKSLFRAFVAVAALGLLATILAGVVTFRVSQDRFARDVTLCFLNTSVRPPAVQAECNRRFPGRETSLREGQGNLRVFRDLIEWAKSKGFRPPPATTPKG